MIIFTFKEGHLKRNLFCFNGYYSKLVFLTSTRFHHNTPHSLCSSYPLADGMQTKTDEFCCNFFCVCMCLWFFPENCHQNCHQNKELGKKNFQQNTTYFQFTEKFGTNLMFKRNISSPFVREIHEIRHLTNFHF